jgi:hypothetical protein
MAHTKKYIVTFQTNNKSNFGLELFEKMLITFVTAVKNHRRSYHCTVEEVTGDKADLLSMFQEKEK